MCWMLWKGMLVTVRVARPCEEAASNLMVDVCEEVVRLPTPQNLDGVSTAESEVQVCGSACP
jgi:hypothetical protein